MEISKIRQLDVGMSGIGCAGEVSVALQPQHKTGVSNGQSYDFWSQFIHA